MRDDSPRLDAAMNYLAHFTWIAGLVYLTFGPNLLTLTIPAAVTLAGSTHRSVVLLRPGRPIPDPQPALAGTDLERF